MDETSFNFVGGVPENYDKRLGPNIFVDYARDIAARAAALSPVSVLELAGGTGIVSRALRDALPKEADLVVTDLNAPMLDIARAKFGQGERVSFRVADAQALAEEDDSFDLLVCQFGVMFFPDKAAGYREALRVLGPGGTYLFSTWDTIERNSFSRIAYEIGSSFFPDDPPGFYQVPFSYADPERVLADARAAGFDEAYSETLELLKTVADPAAFARGLVFGNPLAEEIRNRGGVDPEEVVAAIHSGLLSTFGSDPCEMTLSAHVFSCRKHA